MEYLPYGVGLIGLLLLASSYVSLDQLKSLIPKVSDKPVSDISLLENFTKIRALLVGKLSPDVIAQVDKVVLDEVTGGDKDEPKV